MPPANAAGLLFSATDNRRTSNSSWSQLSLSTTKRVWVRSGPQGSWDLAPGGLRDTQGTLKKQTVAAADEAGADANFLICLPNHCFIPTVSALGFQYRTMGNYQGTSTLPNPFTVLAGRDLVCNDEIPFDAYYAPYATNTDHVKPDANGLLFLTRELLNVTPNPTLATADNVICPNGLGRYTVAQPCQVAGRITPATTYAWSFPLGGLQFTPGSPTTGPTITVQPTASAQINHTYSVVVTATRAGSAPASTTQFVEISYGTAQVLIRTIPNSANEIEVGSVVEFEVAFNRTTGPITWGVSIGGYSGNDAAYRQQMNNCPNCVRYKTRRTGPMVVTAEVTSLCNSTVAVEGTSPNLMVVSGQSRAQPAYPNPADASVTILLTDASDPTEPVPSGTKATLYNSQGTVVEQETVQPGQIQIQMDTATAPEGLYNIVVEKPGEAVEQYHISVDH